MFEKCVCGILHSGRLKTSFFHEILYKSGNKVIPRECCSNKKHKKGKNTW
jgi:hypothetical protein